LKLRRALGVLVAALPLALAVPSTAGAQAGTTYPTGDISNNHGRLVKTIWHPNRVWFVNIAVDTHFGYNGAADADADFASPVGRISQGQGARSFEVRLLRLGYEGSAKPAVDDCRPSKSQGRAERNNGRTPCNPLHNRVDYEPDVNQVIGTADWIRLSCTDTRIASRMEGAVRWADGSLSVVSERTSYTAHDLNGCNTDLRVEKFANEGTETKTTYTKPDDDFVYQINVTTGNEPSPATVLTDTLPAGLDPPTFDPADNCTYNATTRTITCNLGTIRANGTRIVLIGTSTTAEASGNLTNTASVDSAAGDPNLGNNTDSYTLTPA
jgi:hypothetical protein